MQRGIPTAQAIPTFEHVTSPAGGFWQVRQPSVHSTQVASGGANTLTLTGAGFRGTGTSKSAASAGASQSAAVAATSQADVRAVMRMSLPIPVGGVEAA